MKAATIPIALKDSGRKRVQYVRDIDKLSQIPEEERQKLKAVSEKYVFRRFLDWYPES